jgi:DNA-binding transcriptional MerR regulator
MMMRLKNINLPDQEKPVIVPVPIIRESGAGGSVADVQDLLKFRELVEQSGLPEAEVKRHVRNFGEFFCTTKQGRTKLYAGTSVDLLKQIHDLTEQGTTVPSIRGILRGSQKGSTGVADLGMCVTMPVVGLADEKAGESLTLGVLSDIGMLQASLRELQEEVALLRGQVRDHDQKIISHQQQLKRVCHEVETRRMDALAERLERQQQPFWKRFVSGDAQKKL